MIGQPCGTFCGIAVTVIDAGDPIIRTKRWKRKNRPDKVKTRIVGRKPLMLEYRDTYGLIPMPCAAWEIGVCIKVPTTVPRLLVNREALKILKSLGA